MRSNMRSKLLWIDFVGLMVLTIVTLIVNSLIGGIVLSLLWIVFVAIAIPEAAKAMNEASNALAGMDTIKRK